MSKGIKAIIYILILGIFTQCDQEENCSLDCGVVSKVTEIQAGTYNLELTFCDGDTTNFNVSDTTKNVGDIICY